MEAGNVMTADKVAEARQAMAQWSSWLTVDESQWDTVRDEFDRDVDALIAAVEERTRREMAALEVENERFGNALDLIANGKKGVPRVVREIARAALAQQPSACGTCGGNREVPGLPAYVVPCPDCSSEEAT